MVQTGNGRVVPAAGGREGSNGMPKLACFALVGISLAMVISNIVINIRNDQRLSVDDHGWLMNGVIVGTLSLAPTAAMSFAGYRWKRGGKWLAIMAMVAAIPLVIFNLWSASEYVGDQMLGRQQLQEQRFIKISSWPRCRTPRSCAPSARPKRRYGRCGV
jgi:hypothetical protein